MPIQLTGICCYEGRGWRNRDFRWLMSAVLALVVTALANPSLAVAQPAYAPPSTILMARSITELNPPRSPVAQPSPASAAAFSTGRASAVTPAQSTAAQTLACQPPAAAPELVELARALRWNPDLIYEYVHNNITTIPIYDSAKGALGTLIDRAGTPIDQAELMFVLLQQACLSPQYQVGMIYLSAAQLDEWLGTSTSIPNNPGQFDSLANILETNGFCAPATPSSCGGLAIYVQGSQVTGADVPWIWVSVPIGASTYQYDPASKIFPFNGGDGISRSTGLGAALPTALRYNQASFLNGAEAGATGINTPALAFSALGRTNVRTALNSYAVSLRTYIRNTLPSATIADVIGGATVRPLPPYTPPTSGDTRWGQSSLPYLNHQNVPPSQTSDVSSFRTALTLTLGYNDTSNTFHPLASEVTLNSSDLHGHRLSVMFGASSVPSLLLDGAIQAGGTGTVPTPYQLTIRLAINHPHLPCESLPFPSGCAGGPGPAIDNVRVSPAPSAIYLIGTGWGGASRGLIEKHRRQLQQYLSQGQANGSEPVLGESLAMIGAAWVAQYTLAQEITGELAGTTNVYLHAIGIVGFKTVGSSSGPYVDLPLNTIGAFQRSNRPSLASPTPSESAAFFTAASMSSMQESGTIEQMQPKDVNGNPTMAASTVKLLDLWSTAGTIYTLNDPAISGDTCAYYGQNVRSNLLNFLPADLARIDNLLGYSPGSQTCSSPASTTQVIVPSSGALNVGLWTGTGFLQIGYSSGQTSVTGVGAIITGGLSGGEPGSYVPPDVANQNQAYGPVDPVSDQVVGPPSQAAVDNSSQQSTNITTPIGGSSSIHATGGDPVDLVAGSYTYSHQDLAVGSGAIPISLPFARSYDSALGQTGQNSSGLGNGWFHNFDITALPDSDGFEGMGQSSPISGAAAIAALYVVQDILNLQTSAAKPADRLIVAAQIERWLMDQLTGNVVSVARAGSVERFIRLMDQAGTTSYNPPLGSSGRLNGTTGGGYAYQTKTGDTILFNPTTGAAAGKAVSWTAPSGPNVTFTYNTGGKLQSVASSASQRQLNFLYAGSQLTSVDDNAGTIVAFAYDGQNNLQSVTDPLHNQTYYGYGALGQLTQIFYPSNPGKAFVLTSYDTLGRPSQQVDASGNTSTLYFAGTRSEVDDPGGGAHVSYFSARGKLLAQIEGLGSSLNNGSGYTTTYTYDGLDRAASTTLPEGGITTYVYDTSVNPWANNIASITQQPKPGSPLTSLVTTFSFDGVFNKPTRITDPRGLVTTMNYDSATGNVASVVADAGGAGHLNATSTFSYNGIGQLVGARDPLGITSVNVYDAFGNLTASTRDAGGTGHLNQTSLFGYDAVGNLTSRTDPNGNVTTFRYDANRRLIGSTPPGFGGAATSVSYDADGRPVTTANTSGGAVIAQTTSTYTPTGKVATTTDPNGNVTRYSYDANDRLVGTQDPLGRVTATAYDALGRTASISNPAIQATPLAQFGYSPDGLLASVTDANGNAIAFAYDGLDRLGTTTYPNSTTETLSYDPDGNVLTRKTRAGTTITFTYDNLNRVGTKSVPSSPTVTYGYDLAGRLIAASDTSAAITSPATAGTLSTSTFTYDALNRLTVTSFSPVQAQAPPAASSANFTHAYNGVNQRNGQTATDASFWAYPTSASSTSYSRNNLNQYTAVGSVNPTYDGNGNLTYDGTYTYCYDAESHLAAALTAGTCSSPTTTVATYAYDPLGRRKSKTVSSTTTLYLTDPQGRTVVDYDGGTGAVQRWYAFGLGLTDVASQVNVAAGTRASLVPDIQGSIAASLDSGTGALTKAGYLPYGGSPSNTGTFRYTGQRIDAETGGLYDYRARIYAPGWGRFLQPDPIGLRGGLHLYAYVGNDPLNATDPLGLCDNPQGCGSSGFSNYMSESISSLGQIPSDIGKLLSNPADVPGAIGASLPGLTPALGELPQSLLAVVGAIRSLGVQSSPSPLPQQAPDFVVAPNGTAYPVPPGATGPTPVINPSGNQTGIAFSGGNGGANGQVSTMRLMNPTLPRGNSPGYPNGYIVYENSTSPTPQLVDPVTGQTTSRALGHFGIQ